MSRPIDIEKYIPPNMSKTEFFGKLKEMLQYVLDMSFEELKDVKYKYTHPELLGDAMVKEIIKEQGFDYIVDVMNTINGLQFNTMLSFMDLINQLKGSRQGLELVLKLLGFDSIIKEWWEDESDLGARWTYEIIVLFNTSNVQDIFDTLEKIQTFSDNYVLADISNVEVRFIFSNFADKAPILGGFSKKTVFGTIIERAV